MWRQGQTHHPYTLSFLGTWGHGDTSLGYIDVETGTDTPPLYTLISGDVGTRGQYFKIYTCIPTETGTDTHPLYTLIFWDVGTRGQFSRIYTYGDWDRHITHIHSHFGDVGTRGQLPRIYKYGDRDIKYHPYTLSFLGTLGQFSRIYTYIIGADHTTPIHSDLKLHSCI